MAGAKSTIKPLGGNVLVEPEAVEQTTPSGLVISSSAKGEKPQRGTVIALGTGKLNDKGDKIPFNVKVGDLVLFKKYAPDTIEIDNKELLIMEESDILAVLKP
jgi:chaperonin GroES